MAEFRTKQMRRLHVLSVLAFSLCGAFIVVELVLPLFTGGHIPIVGATVVVFILMLTGLVSRGRANPSRGVNPLGKGIDGSGHSDDESHEEPLSE